MLFSNEAHSREQLIWLGNNFDCYVSATIYFIILLCAVILGVNQQNKRIYLTKKFYFWYWHIYVFYLFVKDGQLEQNINI